MEDVENTSPKSAKSGDGAPKREKGWSAINKVNKELKEKKRENEKLQARVVEVSGAMDGLRQQLWELELVNAEAAARVEELEDAATARDAKSSEAEDQLLDAGAAEVAAAVADERARAAVERRALEAAHLAAVAELEAARLAAVAELEAAAAADAEAHAATKAELVQARRAAADGTAEARAATKRSTAAEARAAAAEAELDGLRTSPPPRCVSVEPESPDKDGLLERLEGECARRAAELQRRAAELQDARKAALDSNWRATQLEAELKTLRETKDATKKRLSVLDAQTQQARLAAEESRAALLRGTLARYLAAPSDDLARTLAALLDVDAPRGGDRAACGPALPAALARRLAAAARATFGRREARTAL